MIKEPHFTQFKKALDAVHPIGCECFEKIKQLSEYNNLESNEYFSRSGDFNRLFGFVVSGALRVFYLSADGQEYNKIFLLKNSFLSASIVPEQRSITSIQAVLLTQLITFKYSSFISLVKEFKHLSVFKQKLIECYLEGKQEREIQLLSKTAEENYLLFLLQYPDFHNKIPNYHVASYLGITPTQLSRIRRKIKNNINIC